MYATNLFFSDSVHSGLNRWHLYRPLVMAMGPSPHLEKALANFSNKEGCFPMPITFDWSRFGVDEF